MMDILDLFPRKGDDTRLIIAKVCILGFAGFLFGVFGGPIIFQMFD